MGRLGRYVVAGVACAALVATAAVASTQRGSDSQAVSNKASSAPEIFKVYRSDPSQPEQARQVYLDMMDTPSVDSGFVPELTNVSAAVACPPQRCVDRELRLPKGVHVASSMVRVLLPVGYEKKKNRNKRYPVVYLYNGQLSDYSSWSRKTLITEMSEAWNAIIVMPEGAKLPVAGMYSDWFDGTQDWETFHTETVIDWVDRKFRTAKGARVAAGSSAGGLGAINYAARHPGLFKSVLSISGTVDNRLLAGMLVPEEVLVAAGVGIADMRPVWGVPGVNQDVWDAHNPTKLAKKLKRVDLFVSSGTGFATANPDVAPGTSQMELALWQCHRTFLGALTDAGIPFTARIAQGGAHSWPDYHSAMAWGLPKAIAAAR